MRRRKFIAGLGGAAVAWPLAAWAQQPAMPVIGFLYGGAASAGDAAAFRKGLGETGYFEGQNVTVDYHWAEGRYDLLPALALELVHRQVAAIVAVTTPAVLAAKTATGTIPIIFNIGADPIKFGLVSSLNRPGANVTGVSVITNALSAKNLELLHALVPQASSIAMLVNPANQNAGPDTTVAQDAARALDLRLLVLNARDQSGIDAAFASLVQQRAGALLVSSDLFFASARDQFVALAARHQVPAIYDRREFTDAGGLISYGPSIPGSMREVGVYTGRILKGEKPADLPVFQPTKFELVINLKTAKTLGLTIPETLLATADNVIE